MITFLKRRFSSGDLEGETGDQQENEGISGFLNFAMGSNNPAAPVNPATGQQALRHQQPGGAMQSQQSFPPPQQVSTTGPVPAGPPSRTTFPSAPTSPTKSFMQPMGGITGQITNTISRSIFSTNKPVYNKDRCKTLLVIDEPQTDWSKYFRGRKILNDWDIRVEQAQFSEINMTVYSDQGCFVDIQADRSGTKVAKSFKPDFVLVRQHPTDAMEDWQKVITGFMYGGVPSMNSLHAVYNMKDRAWLFAHLLLIRNRLGRENFPLIEQAYFPDYKEMVVAPCFPIVVKIGHSHAGKGKIKIDNHFGFQDASSVVAVTNTFATTEPFVDAKCDLRIQKIGGHYRAFVRKSLSGTWKANSGSALLEQANMNDKFRVWIDEVSRLFGGLDICSLGAVQSKTGDMFVFEANGSDMTLLGDTQEEDRRQIADLVAQKMQMYCRGATMTKAPSLQGVVNHDNAQNVSSPTSGQNLPHHTPNSAGGAPPPTNLNPGVRSGPPVGPPGIGNSSGMGPPSAAPLQPVRPGGFGSTGTNPAPTPPQPPPPSSQQQSATMGPRSSVPDYYGGGQMSATTTAAVARATVSPEGGPRLDQQRTANMGHMPPPPGPPSAMGAAAVRNSGPPGSQPYQPNGNPSSGPGPVPQPPHHASLPTAQNAPPGRPNLPPRQTSLRSNASVDEGDDTMKNLRKTFAGIFGDM